VKQFSIAIAMALLVCASAHAEERATVFGNVRFGESPSAVADAMAAVGLMPYDKARANDRFALDQTFLGIVLGEKALVMTLFSERGGLEKMIVSFVTDDKNCLAFYREFKGELKARYGSTSADVEQYDAPYSDGGHVGYEQIAIKNGKGHINALWQRQDGGVDGGRISLSVEENLTVYLTYESATWSAESDRRKTSSFPQ
jgi:hypothetical protein